jgi:predicted nucleotidyltransferase
MVAVVKGKLDAIAHACRKYGVKRLYVFGSAVRNDFRPGESDVDLLVDFGDMDGRSKAHAYFDLHDELSRVLGTEVDLVMVAAVKNRYIAREIEQTKQQLYAA